MICAIRRSLMPRLAYATTPFTPPLTLTTNSGGEALSTKLLVAVFASVAHQVTASRATRCRIAGIPCRRDLAPVASGGYLIKG